MSKKARSSDVEANPAVLVTGGSGYLGSSVVRHLSLAGETVVSMYRHRLPEPCARVFPVCSDLSNAELLAAPLRGVHTVIHLAWDNTFTGPGCELSSDPSDEKNLTKNIRTLKTLLQAMETARTKRLIFMSAMGAGRHAESGFLTKKYLGEFEKNETGFSFDSDMSPPSQATASPEIKTDAPESDEKRENPFLPDDQEHLSDAIDKRIDEALELAEKVRSLEQKEDDLDVPAFLRDNHKNMELT